MKRDMDLVRDILLAVEASAHDPRAWMREILPDRDQQEVAYHVHLLHEARLIEAQNLTTMSDYDWRPKRLTYEGHDLLDSIRDPAVWSKTKSGVQAAGGFTFDLVKALGKGLIKKKIEEQTGITLDL